MGFPARFSVLGAGFLALSSLAGNEASAGSDAAGAQALFEEGKRQLDAGNLDVACPKLEESLRMDDAIGTRFQLARCHELAGRTASAWTLYLQVASEARQLGHTDRETFARAEAKRVEPLLAHLTIDVPSDVRIPGLQVSRNRVDVGPGQWDESLPVDPGTYEVVVSAPGKKEWTGSVEVQTGSQASISVPTLEDEPSGASGLAPEMPVVTGDPSDSRGGWSGWHWLGLGTFGVGVVGAGVGGILGIVAKSKATGAQCTETQCAGAAYAQQTDAYATGNVATAVVIAGASVAVIGGIVFLLAPDAEVETEHALEASPLVGDGVQGVLVSGRF